MSVLAEIVATTREAVARRAAALPLEDLTYDAGPGRSFHDALAAPGLSVIAEHKRSSPSAGLIRDDLSLEEIVGAYERGGAAALSVLTEESRFGGSLADLGAARAASSLPILRKDFIVDTYQVHEALAAGADAILLIVAALPAGDLAALHELALSIGLDALVEVHDSAELSAAAAVGARIIGVNNRDLATLQVDTRRTFELLPAIPDGGLVVAESGFSNREQLEELAEAGVDAVLIGEALMRSPEIEAACRAFTGTRARL